MILLNKDAQNLILKGVDLLANTVGSTMGAGGKTVVIEKPFGQIRVTKDGITVAEETYSTNPTEQLGIEILRQAGRTTLKDAEDGTSTSIILGAALAKGVMEVSHSLQLKDEMLQTTDNVITALRELATPIARNSIEVEQVATISANNDNSIGKLIATAIREVDVNSKITVEESKDSVSSVRFTKGISFNKGYMSANFVTDKGKGVINYKNPLILFLDESVRDLQRLIPVIEFTQNPTVDRPLIVICDDMIEQALNMMVYNVNQKGLKLAVVKAPSFGDNRKDVMSDMAIACGGVYVSPTNGLTLETLGNRIPEVLGEAESIVIKKNETIIVEGKGAKEEIEERIYQIKDEGGVHIEDRITRLSGNIATIVVGGTTDVEMKERKDRVDDALGATLSALEEGVVLGGGYTLAKIGEALTDDTVGARIVKKALLTPQNVIRYNAGYELISKAEALNVVTGTIGKLKEEGIIDSVKVLRTALLNAVSVAITIMSIGVTITMKEEDRPRQVI